MAITLTTCLLAIVRAVTVPITSIANPEQLVRLRFGGNVRSLDVPARNDVLRAGLRSAESIGAVVSAYTFLDGAPYVEFENESRPVNALFVSANYFTLMGVHPLAGRTFLPSDSLSEVRVAVIGERLWNQLGMVASDWKSFDLLVNGFPATVVGVLSSKADVPGWRTDIWLLPPSDRWGEVPLNVARVPGGVPQERLAADAGYVASLLAARATNGLSGVTLRTSSLVGRPSHARRYELPLRVSALCVVLIAVLNILSLQLSQVVGEVRATATRIALGATPGAIVLESTVQGLLVGLAGLGCAVVLTSWGLHFVDATLPTMLGAYVVGLQFDSSSIMAASCAALVVVLLFAVTTIPFVARQSYTSDLQAGFAGYTSSTGRGWGVFIALQVAFVMVLLSGTALVIRASRSMDAVRTGAAKDEILVAEFASKSESEPSPAARTVADRLVAVSATVPGIDRVAAFRWARPHQGMLGVRAVTGEVLERSVPQLAMAYTTAGFLETTGERVLHGRAFFAREIAPVAIVDETAARRLWPGSSPLGQAFRVGRANDPRARFVTVVGVVPAAADLERVQDSWFASEAVGLQGLVLIHMDADPTLMADAVGLALAIRPERQSVRSIATLRRALSSQLPEFTLRTIARWDELFGLAEHRKLFAFMSRLTTLFAACALVLAVAGIATTVTQRVLQSQRELAIRQVLGARRLLAIIHACRPNLQLTLVGVAVGLVLAKLTTSVFRVFLVLSITPNDVTIFLLPAVTILVVSAVTGLCAAHFALQRSVASAIRDD